MALYMTNVASLAAQRSLSKATKSLNTSYQRLASGRRINSAKDDAAGLQIANRMTSQINGLTQANRNANDAISMCQTAEGALDEVSNMMQRLRVLALQSANGTNSDYEREAMQAEVKELTEEIVRIGRDTSFGGNIGLFGSDSQTSFQVGAYANQVITLDMQAMSSMASFGGQSITCLSLLTADSSQDAIGSLDDMIKNVDSYRARLGAVQNRMEYTISSNEIAIENATESRARIMDTDYAAETANLAQQSILQQIAASILAQANSQKSLILSLIGG